MAICSLVARQGLALGVVALVVYLTAQAGSNGREGVRESRSGQPRKLLSIGGAGPAGPAGPASAEVQLQAAAEQAAFCAGLAALDYPAPVLEIAWSDAKSMAEASAVGVAAAPNTAAGAPQLLSAQPNAPHGDTAARRRQRALQQSPVSLATAVAVGPEQGTDQRRQAWEHLVRGRHQAAERDAQPGSTHRPGYHPGTGSGYASSHNPGDALDRRWYDVSDYDDDWGYDSTSHHSLSATYPGHWQSYEAEQQRAAERRRTRTKVTLVEGVVASAAGRSSPPYSMYVFADNDIVSGFVQRGGWEGGESAAMADMMEAVAAGAGLERSQVFFVDVGANIGVHGLFMAALGYSVIAFEPLRVNERTLRHSLCANPDLASRFTLIPRGLGNRTVTCAIYSVDSNQGDGTVNCGEAMLPGFIKRQDLHIQRMDDVLAAWVPALAERVGVMKIDVEGNELGVVQGALEFFRAVRPRYVMAECNDAMMLLAVGSKVRHFFETMHELGYSVHRGNFSGVEVPPSSFPYVVEPNIVNYWFVLRAANASALCVGAPPEAAGAPVTPLHQSNVTAAPAGIQATPSPVDAPVTIIPDLTHTSAATDGDPAANPTPLLAANNVPHVNASATVSGVPASGGENAVLYQSLPANASS